MSITFRNYFMAQALPNALQFIKPNTKSFPRGFALIVLIAISYLVVGIATGQAQAGYGTTQEVAIYDNTAQQTIFSLDLSFTYYGLQADPPSASTASGYYLGLDGKTHPITRPGQAAFFPQYAGHEYIIIGHADSWDEAPGGLDTDTKAAYAGAGLGVYFSFGGNDHVSVGTDPLWPTFVSYTENCAGLYALGSSISNVVAGGFSSTLGAVYYADGFTELPVLSYTTAYGYFSSGPGALNMFVFSSAYNTAQVGDPPSWGFELQSDGYIQSSWYGQTNVSWAGVTVAGPSSGSGQTSSGYAGATPPSGMIYPTNSALPTYYFTNLLSGASCSVPPFGQADYAYALQTLDGSLIETLALPTNWSGSVTVSVSNNVVGSFRAGQTVSFTNFPGGGVGQLSLVGDGSPLYISGVGFPIALTFNTSESTLALTPLFLQVTFPAGDQTVFAGSELIIPFSAQSDLPLSYQWEFNGANLAGQTNAILTITNPTTANSGVYGAVITTTGTNGIQNWQTPGQNVTVQTTVQFTVSPTNGATPLSVQFDCPGIDSVGSNIVSWLWNFGDGTASTQQNPSHAYLNAGVFSPTLIATNGNGTTVVGFGPAISVTNPLVQFTASPTIGTVPLAVQFNCPSVDSLGNSLEAWQWNFGDGTTSTLQNPTHTYLTANTFSPTLIATNINGSPVIGSGSSDITTTNLMVQFTASPTSGAATLTVQFNCPGIDSAGNNLNVWQWNFGDGTTSTLQNPTHTYLTAGTFSSALIATNGNGMTVVGFGPAISVTNPIVQFTANPTSGVTPLAVQFNCPSVDSAGNSLNVWQWNFGDGTTSTLQNPSHTYLTAGAFIPALITTNGNGTTVIGSGPAISVTSPIVQFTASPTYGAPPINVQFNCPNADNSGSRIVIWQWNFGDGTTNSSLQNPSHTYAEPGYFSPTLSATNASGFAVTGVGTNVTVTSAAAHLYVASRGKGIIGEYGLDGSAVNPSLISGLTNLTAIAISGTNLFVLENGTIAKFSTSGTTVNASLISGLNNAVAIAASGNNLFVVNDARVFGPFGPENSGTVAEYTTSGAIVNASLIGGISFDFEAIAVSGNDLFIVDVLSSTSPVTFYEYTTSGAFVSDSGVISGLTDAAGVAISGTNLFVANNSFTGGPATIGEYTTSGATVNGSLISGFELIGYNGIAISGTNLFIADEQAGTVGEYATSGATVNASLIPGLDVPIGIAISPVPPVSLQAAAFGGQPQLIVSGPAGPAIVQASTNLLNWVNVYTNVPPFTFTDSAAPVFPFRFYRIMTPQ